MDAQHRVELWDRVFARVRSELRAGGMREVSTRIRVPAPAVEPWIEPIAAPPGWLATSPELAMKRLLAAGSGPIFQIAHVFRREEIGALHEEEFHLVEWYRFCEFSELLGDVSGLIRAVFDVAGMPPPEQEMQIEFLTLLAETTGVVLRGDESAQELEPASRRVRRGQDRPLAKGGSLHAHDDVAQLAAWTELFTDWSDGALREWLEKRPRTIVHLVAFPAPLAALASVHGTTANRAETYVGAIELANTYAELGDPAEQERRFLCVNALRRAAGSPPVPIDQTFLASLSSLPACCGSALGLDRLVAVATGRETLAGISPWV